MLKLSQFRLKLVRRSGFLKHVRYASNPNPTPNPTPSPKERVETPETVPQLESSAHLKDFQDLSFREKLRAGGRSAVLWWIILNFGLTALWVVTSKMGCKKYTLDLYDHYNEKFWDLFRYDENIKYSFWLNKEDTEARKSMDEYAKTTAQKKNRYEKYGLSIETIEIISFVLILQALTRPLRIGFYVASLPTVTRIFRKLKIA